MKTIEDTEWELQDDAIQAGVMSKEMAKHYDWFGLAKSIMIEHAVDDEKFRQRMDLNDYEDAYYA